jgi:hypothetical protein
MPILSESQGENDVQGFLERIVERAHDPARATDCWHGWRDERGNEIQVVAEVPVTREAIYDAEQALGFALPELLRRLYEEVGNGGFGPGYGLFGLFGTWKQKFCCRFLPSMSHFGFLFGIT